ncbi:MAG: peroxiredoxin-like family protein [Cyanobacteria bacterium P01_F01_bin.150]
MPATATSLTDAIAQYKAQFRQKVADPIKATMATATQNLIDSGIADRTLKEGETLPDIQLPNATGQIVAIRDLLQAGPVVISFYRGGWCPYCNLELKALQNKLPEIKGLGANLVAISPETPDASLSTAEKNELEFEVLSDVGNQVAKALGLAFTLPEELRPIYSQFGIDIPAHNGDTTFELPIPATYVIAADGTVAFAFVDPDYTQRLDPSKIVDALKALAS